MGALLRTLFASTTGRWVTAGVVTLLLGGAVYKWIDFKSDLRDEGHRECVQLVTQATVDALEAALFEERVAREELRQRLFDAEVLNAEARARAAVAEQKLEAFENERKEQANSDPTYREWRDTPLPDGVSNRLRALAGSNQNTGR